MQYRGFLFLGQPEHTCWMSHAWLDGPGICMGILFAWCRAVVVLQWFRYTGQLASLGDALGRGHATVA